MKAYGISLIFLLAISNFPHIQFENLKWSKVCPLYFIGIWTMIKVYLQF